MTQSVSRSVAVKTRFRLIRRREFWIPYEQQNNRNNDISDLNNEFPDDTVRRGEVV